MGPSYSVMLLLSVVNVDRCLTEDSQVVSPPGSSGEEVLFLTPILEKGQINEARELSRVTPDVGQVQSYSGYFTVNKECQSNLFFWFFPAKNNNWKNAPVMVWLQGGPGASSMYGLFTEIGPFSFVEQFENRELSWHWKNSLLFIDQPVGTGFSFSGKGCFATNETQVAEDLYSALTQFYQLFPEIVENKFFIAGESYAGFYVPSIGYKIHQSNKHASVKINLQGMLIGNGYMDPSVQDDKKEYLYQVGLGDLNSNLNLSRPQSPISNSNQKGAYTNGTYRKCYKNYSKGYDIYNYLYMKCDYLDSPYTKFLDMQTVRKSIHVRNQSFANVNHDVYDHIHDENIKIKPLVEELLEHYPMVFYNGQLDTVCPYPLLVKFLRALNWSRAEDYERAPRHEWCVDGTLAGFYKSAGNLHEIMVRAAGHSVPRDQPLWALTLANSVTSNPSDNPLGSLSTCSSLKVH